MGIYCVGNAVGTNVDGSTWLLGFTSVAAAFANATVIADAAPVLIIDSAHAFAPVAAITWTPTANQRVTMISVNRNGNTINQTYSAWATGAKEDVGAANAAFTMTAVDGLSWFIYGMTLNGATNANANSDIVMMGATSVGSRLHMMSCTLKLNNTATTSQIIIGSIASASLRGCKIILEDCTFNLNASRAGTFIFVQQCDLEIINPTVTLAGATKPVVFIGFVATSTYKANVLIRDGDLSGFDTSAGSPAYFDVGNFTSGKIVLQNLNLNASSTIVTGSWPAASAGSITRQAADSADTLNILEYRDAYGTLLWQPTTYANDNTKIASLDGAYQIITTAACNEHFPFAPPIPLSVFNTVTSSQTMSLEINVDSATTMTDRHIWADFSYPSSTTRPSYTHVTSRNATPYDAAAGANLAAGAASWTGTGGFINSPQALKLQSGKVGGTVTFSAADQGLLRGRVFFGFASLTAYLDTQLRAA